MPSVYLAPVTGDGLSPATAFRPTGFDGVPAAMLMIDTVRKQALVASAVDTVTGTGIDRLLTGPSWEDLRANGKQTSPNNARRNQINTWLTNAGYQPTTAAAQPTWYDIVLFIARQVNPDASLDNIFVSAARTA